MFHKNNISFENNPSKLGNKINELKLKFEKARQMLAAVPGIDMSHTEQQEYYETLLKQYKHEHELLNSYKEMCKFDVTQLEQQPDDETVLKSISNGSNNSNENNIKINYSDHAQSNGIDDINITSSFAQPSSSFSNMNTDLNN
jgi:hypothetical protein